MRSESKGVLEQGFLIQNWGWDGAYWNWQSKMRGAGLPSAYFVDLVRLIIIYTKVATGILVQSIELEGSWSWIWVDRERKI